MLTWRRHLIFLSVDLLIKVARWQHPVNSVCKTHGTLISSQVSLEIRSSPAASSPARTSAPPTPAALELSASLEMTGTLRLYVVVDSIFGIAVFGSFVINMINGYTNSHQRLKLDNIIITNYPPATQIGG